MGLPVFWLAFGAFLGWIIIPKLRPGGFGIWKDMAIGASMTFAALIVVAILRELVGNLFGVVVVAALIGAGTALFASKLLRSN